MTAKIDQKAYLQKYLSGSSDKKKKKKKVVKGKGFKIIDDDLDLSKLQELQGDELDILDQGEDAPQIAGIIDERPEEVKKAELFKSSSKWRVVTQDDGFNTKLKVEEIKRDIKEVEKENEVIFGKMFSDSEDETKNDSDPSPPRKHTDERSFTPNKPRNASDSDFSPPRRTNKSRELTPEKMSRRNKISSPKRNRNGDDSDVSPPRKQSKGKLKNRRDSDLSPPRRIEGHSSQYSSNLERRKERKSRWDNANDKYYSQKRSTSISPKRFKKSTKSKNNKSSDSDNSPQRKSHKNKRNVSDSDSSPPRKQKKEKRNGSTSRKEKQPQVYKHYAESSTSRKERNVQKTKDHHKNGSLSRKEDSSTRKASRNNGSDNSDLSPPRKVQRHGEHSDSDLSPPRKNKKNNDSDISPHRDKRKDFQNSPPPSNKKMAKTLEGKMAGLQDAKQLRQENESFRRRENEAYSKLTDDVSGRNAKAVSRKSKRENSEERQKQKEKAEKQKELDEKYKKWSRGLKQIEAQEERVQDFITEAAKPLARYKDDRDLEGRLKDVERAGDPMLNYIRDRKRERGELAPAKPAYKGNFPPNRFNIPPGYRWDGVDRSNGYEKKFFDQQSKKKALEEDAYKWSTEDL
ncbi:BUD13 homolog [Pieris rapae]|uniref:BUD13 homolog n=1 Tax=Pieris rapae TaxID=64459 RepID=UPI001E27E76E|nr:BUD13 homolog [Pieris rapae]XP_045485394.1 BUD13 homolog [Pieris rapae]